MTSPEPVPEGSPDDAGQGGSGGMMGWFRRSEEETRRASFFERYGGVVLLVLDEPTQGVDVGAKAEILDLVADAASQGVAAVLCSSDLDDLAAICSRVLIVRGGSIAAELTGEQINRESITEECYRSSDAVSA